MRRRIQIWPLLLLLAAVIACVGPESPAPAEAPKPPADFRPYTQNIDAEVKFEMLPIPGGEFVMGSPANEKGRSDHEGPQHAVTIRPFWLGKTEVTWDEYDIFRKEVGVENPEQSEEQRKASVDALTGPTPPYGDPLFGMGHDNMPAVNMTHHAAMEYCRWLAKKTGKPYRLPTEAEWEYACRAGTKGAYFFGDDPKKMDEYAWFADNAEDSTHEVGTKKPNPWGLYDIYGNVAEWCFDSYQKDAYKQHPTDKPTLSPVILPKPNRYPDVTRGGSYAEKADQCRSAARMPSDKQWIKLDPQRPKSIWWNAKAEFVGFRVARPVEEQENLKNVRSKVTREND
jgi:formylglycine-generating enzyme required for sulfatase activity